MAGKSRKDSRGYALRTGECQRADGRYSYSYTDKRGDRHSVYAPSLVELRAKEKEIAKNRLDGLDPLAASRLTLNDMFDRYISQKYDLKNTTKAGYIYTYNHLVRDSFGKNRLVNIKYTDVKKFYHSLIVDEGLKPASVENVHTVIHPSLQLAVREELIRINPSDGVMGEIKKSKIWTKPKRHALTIPQQKAFMNFIESDSEATGWVPVITVLLGTGMRIGECLGLRWEDVNFKERYISVNHNFVERPDPDYDMKIVSHIQTPKTEAGKRTIPMVDEVFDAFIMEYQIQQCIGFCEEEIDGYSGFIFSTAQGKLYRPGSVNDAIHRCTNKYNRLEKAAAKKEKRDPILLPSFSAHNLRHTFCTRLCENESNLKVIQDIMGHADIKTTMDIYAECTHEKKQEAVSNLQGKIIIK